MLLVTPGKWWDHRQCMSGSPTSENVVLCSARQQALPCAFFGSGIKLVKRGGVNTESFEDLV